MTHKIQKTAMMLTMALMTVTPAWAATDYSNMSNEELSNVRGTMQGAGEEEQDAFRSEWQQRTQNMATEERQQYTGRPANAAADGSGAQQGTGQRRGGGGGGGGRKH
jgi:hypothetical protein